MALAGRARVQVQGHVVILRHAVALRVHCGQIVFAVTVARHRGLPEIDAGSFKILCDACAFIVEQSEAVQSQRLIPAGCLLEPVTRIRRTIHVRLAVTAQQILGQGIALFSMFQNQRTPFREITLARLYRQFAQRLLFGINRQQEPEEGMAGLCQSPHLPRRISELFNTARRTRTDKALDRGFDLTG